jgi:hypothetical protein
MDVSKGVTVGQIAPRAQPEGAAGPVASGAAPEKSFATLLAEGTPAGPSSVRPDSGRCPFNAPIFDADEPVAPRARKVDRSSTPAPSGAPRATLEVVGERAGTSAAAAGLPAPAGTWARMADQALRAEDRIDAMIAAGRRGKTFTPSELLGLQMEVFRYSQMVEVISRTTDKVIGGLKQVLGTQV